MFRFCNNSGISAAKKMYARGDSSAFSHFPDRQSLLCNKRRWLDLTSVAQINRAALNGFGLSHQQTLGENSFNFYRKQKTANNIRHWLINKQEIWKVIFWNARGFCSWLRWENWVFWHVDVRLLPLYDVYLLRKGGGRAGILAWLAGKSGDCLFNSQWGCLHPCCQSDNAHITRNRALFCSENAKFVFFIKPSPGVLVACLNYIFAWKGWCIFSNLAGNPSAWIILNEGLLTRAFFGTSTQTNR